MKVQDASAKIATALKDATSLLKSLDALRPQETKPQIAQWMAAIARLSGVSLPQHGRIDQPGPTPPPGTLQALAEDFRKLAQAVDGADADPSPDVTSGYAKLSQMLAVRLKAWRKFQQQEGGALNAVLHNAGQNPAQP